MVLKKLLTNNKIIFVESLVALTVIWALIAHLFNVVNVISSPYLVFTSTVELLLSGDWVRHFVATTRRILYGFALALVIGTLLGVIMGVSNFGEWAFQDYVIVGLAMPDLFAAVFAAMFFGVSDFTPMVAGALISFPFMAQNVYEGIEGIDVGLLEMSEAFNVPTYRLVGRTIIKGVLPEWFAGARYAFALCWKVTTLAEIVAAEEGLGFMIQSELQRLSLTGILTWTLLFTVFILIIEYGILQQIEKRVFDWRQEVSIGFA